MKYVGYGIFLGCCLTALIYIGYGFMPSMDTKAVRPYIYLSLVLYFYLLGFYVGNKHSSFGSGIKAGFVTGLVSILIVTIATMLAHNIFFINETIGDPDTMASFKQSGLLSIRRHIIYSDIRLGIAALVAGPIFTAFCAAGGSFAASKLKHHTSNTVTAAH